MTELLQAHLFLADALTQDSLNALAVLTVLLDPLWIGIEDPNELDPRYHDYQEGDDPKYQALLILRRCFPELYVEAVARLHGGVTANDLETFLCEAFTKSGIPMDDGHLETIWWGIPLPCFGTTLDESDFYENFPETKPILELFGIAPDADGDMRLPNMEAACDIAICLRYSLEAYINDHENLRQIFSGVGWLWGISGNSCVDMDYEAMVEVQPLDWDEDDIAFAVELIAESNEIMGDAMAGIRYLDDQPDAFALLKAHLDLRHFTQQCQLDWSPLTGSPL